MSDLLSLGGGVEAYASDNEDQTYPVYYAGLNPEITEVACAANYDVYMPQVGEYDALVPVAEGVSTRIVPNPDPAVGGHQGYGDTLTFRTGIRDTRWATQLFNGETQQVPMSSVNPPGPVGYNSLFNTVSVASDAAIAGSPFQTPQQNAELYASGLPTAGGDPNYG